MKQILRLYTICHMYAVVCKKSVIKRFLLDYNDITLLTMAAATMKLKHIELHREFYL